jgi:hypothetical protein
LNDGTINKANNVSCTTKLKIWKSGKISDKSNVNIRLYIYILYLLNAPEHPYKAKAIRYRTCRTSELAAINMYIVIRASI